MTTWTMPYTQWVRAKQCGTKIGWSSKKAAKANARSSADTYGEPRDSWTHYRCGHCGLYHVGHKPGGRR